MSDFQDFVLEVEPRLRRALTSRYGNEEGREVTAIALAWGYQHWDRLSAMENPAGYLYRLACNRTRRRRRRVLFEAAEHCEPAVEPGLVAALERLSEHQRVAVVLTLGYDWTLAEVAELTGSSVSTVKTHRRRGLAKLRRALGVDLT
jgi:DNA-directed RNA polymerase specialized sigma24 family protein